MGGCCLIMQRTARIMQIARVTFISLPNTTTASTKGRIWTFFITQCLRLQIYNANLHTFKKKTKKNDFWVVECLPKLPFLGAQESLSSGKSQAKGPTKHIVVKDFFSFFYVEPSLQLYLILSYENGARQSKSKLISSNVDKVEIKGFLLDFHGADFRPGNFQLLV